MWYEFTVYDRRRHSSFKSPGASQNPIKSRRPSERGDNDDDEPTTDYNQNSNETQTTNLSFSQTKIRTHILSLSVSGPIHFWMHLGWFGILVVGMISTRFAQSFILKRRPRLLVRPSFLSTATSSPPLSFSASSTHSRINSHYYYRGLSTQTAAAQSNNDNRKNSNMTPEELVQFITRQNDASNKSPIASLVGNDVSLAMHALYTADAVCFDVDSTVIAEEGIDVLADFLGKGHEVAALTKQAMEGGMKFQDALQLRLDLLQPHREQIQQLLRNQPLQLTTGVDRLMSTLQSKSVDIWLVSGGFRIMIEPVAQQLHIPITNIVANTLLFDTDGKYIGFDPNEPTSRDMGKPKALEGIKSSNGYRTMVMVGDGATDAQAKPPAKAFIGFGGIVEREAVKQKADWFVTDFEDMTKIVELR